MNVTLSVMGAQAQRPGAYRTDITINTATGISQYLFIKQRTINADGSTDDTFCAVASPAEIEDLPQSAPVSPDIFWRDNTVSLISSELDKLELVTQQILNDIQLTIQQANDLSTFSSNTNYTIDSTTGITTT